MGKCYKGYSQVRLPEPFGGYRVVDPLGRTRVDVGIETAPAVPVVVKKDNNAANTDALLPANVYYVAESDNFYNTETNKGMGQGFYEFWRCRKDEFPQRAFADMQSAGATGSTEPPPTSPSYIVPPHDMASHASAREPEPPPARPSYTAEPPPTTGVPISAFAGITGHTPAEIGDKVGGRAAAAPLAQATAERLAAARERLPVPRVTKARMMDELAEFLPGMSDENLAVLAEDLFTIAHEA